MFGLGCGVIKHCARVEVVITNTRSIPDRCCSSTKTCPGTLCWAGMASGYFLSSSGQNETCEVMVYRQEHSLVALDSALVDDYAVGTKHLFAWKGKHVCVLLLSAGVLEIVGIVCLGAGVACVLAPGVTICTRAVKRL